MAVRDDLAMEAGTLLRMAAYGYSEVTGITFALFRRLRKLVWIALGVACLAILMRNDRSHERAGFR